jgi:uncharacterized integral membrane protein
VAHSGFPAARGDWVSNSGRFKLIFSMVGIIVLVIAAIQNSQVIPLRFLFWQARVDGLLLFLILFAFGFLIGAMFSRRPKKAPKENES